MRICFELLELLKAHKKVRERSHYVFTLVLMTIFTLSQVIEHMRAKNTLAYVSTKNRIFDYVSIDMYVYLAERLSVET